jgi:hypothetical protein
LLMDYCRHSQSLSTAKSVPQNHLFSFIIQPFDR